MINLTTVTMQLIDSKPDGIKICRVEGESLVTVVVPREKLAEAKNLPDLPARGVYFLLDEDHGMLNKVYAGQTTQGLTRLDAHKAKKDFWNRAVMFLDMEYNIDRDTLDMLEAKAIGYVREHGSYATDNEATPKPNANPYKAQAVERLFERIRFRMEVLGYDLDRVCEAPKAVGAVFHTKKNGIHASGRYDAGTGRFIVLAGSEIALNRSVLKNQGAIDVRRNMFGCTDGPGKAVTTDDLEFASPSTAAIFVLGGSQNGWTEWVSEDGKTLSDVYRTEGQHNE